MDDVLNALELQAREYRERMKLDADSPLEVDVPNWKAVELIKQYGSLQAAADAIFRPGTVKIVDRYWRDFCYEATQRVNARLARLADLGYFSRIDELTRIAAGEG